MINEYDVVLMVPKDDIGFEPLVYPPLGLLYIAAVLENEGLSIHICDLREGTISIPKAKYYCFTAVTPQINHVIHVVSFIKWRYRDSFTIIGGPHATFTAEETKKYFDAVIVGEGEEQILEVIRTKEKGIYNKKVEKDVNDIPFPARHLLPYSKICTDKLWHGYGFGKGPVATTFITSRGCPFKCSFCCNVVQKVRYRSVENILEEMDVLINKYSCKNFRFIDDNFLMNKKRLRELAPELEKLNIGFRCSGRSDLLTEESCELLKQAGCKEIGFGVETCDNDILKKIQKDETVEQHLKAVKLAKSFGLRTKVFFMSGLPFETFETIEKNKKFVKEAKPDTWISTLFVPFPGCDIWNNREKYKIEIDEQDWTKYFQSYPSKSIIKTDKCSSEELTQHFEEFVKFMEEYRKRK